MPTGTYSTATPSAACLGIAFDPAFASNQLRSTSTTPSARCRNPPAGKTCLSAQNRIARFRANGDVVEPSSHTVLLDDITNDAGNHNGGWLGIGPTDGKLYASVGDGGATSTKAQDLSHFERQDPAHQHQRVDSLRQPLRRASGQARRDLGLRLPESVALPLPRRRPPDLRRRRREYVGGDRRRLPRPTTTAGRPPRGPSR